MGGNPNWWSMNYNMQHNQALENTSTSLSSSLSLNSPYVHHHHHQELPQSWSQLLMGGLASSEDKLSLVHNFQSEKPEFFWENQILNMSLNVPFDVKQEMSPLSSTNYYAHGDHHNQEFYASTLSNNWNQIMPVSSPRSCITNTSLSPNLLDFSHSSKGDEKTQQPDHSSECNSTATGGVSKKARVQSSSCQPPSKVKKEKVGERVTALHQIVSPFGKTDTASVLLETIGYIRFLHGQIQALSSPYLGNESGSIMHQQSGFQDSPEDLRTIGLCLVPLAYSELVGNETGADYWARGNSGGN